MVVGHQAGSVAVCPHQSFTVGGLEFAVDAYDTHLGIDGYQRAVDRTARSGTFHDTHIGESAGLPYSSNDLAELGSVYVNSLVQITGEGLLLLWVLPGRAIGPVQPVRVARYENLRKGDQVSTTNPCFGNAFNHPFRGGCPVEVDGRVLYGSDSHGG